MGNAAQGQQNASHKNYHRQGNICDMGNNIENSVRCSIAENLAENAIKAQMNKNSNVRQGRAHKSLDIKSKKKLSLSKQPNSQSSMRINFNRSASNDCRGIGLTQTEKTVSQYRPSIVVNRPTLRFNAYPNEQTIKKVPIRPRDLPRKFSTDKIIVFPQPIIKRVPLEPKIIVNPPTSSPYIINYVKQPSNLSNSHHSLQSSIVTPFVPSKFATPDNHLHPNVQDGKKLKKVAMNRSHTNHNPYDKEQNNREQSDPNKQNEKKGGKGQSLLIQSRLLDIEPNGEQLFTDPQLYTYITNKEHPCVKEIKSKYALPTYQGKMEGNKLGNLQNIQTLSIKVRPPSSVTLRLEDAIPDEVESKPIIQENIYRFPTLTDFSEDSKTDNTSFIPIIRNNSSQKQQMHGEQLLKYCRPKIDEMVLADLRKLPIKN